MVIFDLLKFVDSKVILNCVVCGYKDINMYGIYVVKFGGLLFIFSCFGFMLVDLFQKVVVDVVFDVGCIIKIIVRFN